MKRQGGTLKPHSEATRLRQPIRELIHEQRLKCEQTLEFYRELSNVMPDEEKWKIKRESPFHDTLRGTVGMGTFLPEDILETALQTMDEYLEAIDTFSDDQYAAFLLGVGLNWIPLRYWGLEELHKYRAEIQKASAFYEELLEKMSEDEHWKVVRSVQWALPGLIPEGKLLPTELLDRARDLVESMIAVLADRPF
jgi:hypothetical protein